MPTVQNIVKSATGGVLSGTATIELIVFNGSAATSFQGFIDIPNDNVSDYTINAPAVININDGIWSANLTGNADIDDAYGATVSSFYKVTEKTDNVSKTYYINVPTSGGPYWVGNIPAVDPGTVSNAVLLQESGTWTPTISGPTSNPATVTGFWERISNDSYHFSINCNITGSWSWVPSPPSTSYMALSLPSSWVRHPTHPQHVAGHVNNAAGTQFWNIIGIVDPYSTSATAPSVKLLTPNILSASYDYRFVNGVGVPTLFTNGMKLAISGIATIDN